MRASPIPLGRSACRFAPSRAALANAAFATLPDGVADRLRAAFAFYDWDAARNEVRWMCSFDTSEDDIDGLVAAIARETSAA